LLGVVPASGGSEEAELVDPDGCDELPAGCVEPEPAVLTALGTAPDDAELGPVGPVAPAGGAVVELPLVELPLVELPLGEVPCCGWLALACCGCGGSTVVDDTCCVVGLSIGVCASGSGLVATGKGAAGGVVRATTGFAFFAFAD
jgi:hypothetical protein